MVWPSANTCPADVFVPAARTSILACPEELADVRRKNPDARDVGSFLGATGVRAVAEAANHPLSERAEEFLEANQVTVLTDYVANLGGLIASFVEWAWRDELRAGRPAEPVIVAVKGYIRQVLDRNLPRLLGAARSREAARRIAEENGAALASLLEHLPPHEGPDRHARLAMTHLGFRFPE